MSEYGKQVKNQMDTYMNNPDSIDKEISDIQNATHGVEVRGALAAGVKKTFDKSKSAEERSNEAFDITQNLLDETFDSAALEANFEQRLDDEIQNLQPEWCQFKNDTVAQLAQTITKQETDITITVGVDGDFNSINDALNYLSKRNKVHQSHEISAEIKLISGFVMQEEVHVWNIDLSWITISSEDEEVVVDKDFIITDPLPNDNIIVPSAFFVIGGALPKINTIFKYDSDYDGFDRDGIVVCYGARAIIHEGCGFKNAFRTNIYARNGFISAKGAIATHARSYGIYADYGSIILAQGADASYTTNRHCFRAKHGSKLSIRGAIATNAGHTGIHANENSTVDAALVNAQDCTEAGIYCDGVSTINAWGANLSGSKSGVISQNGAIVNIGVDLDTGTLTKINDVGQNGIRVVRGGQVVGFDTEIINAGYRAISNSGGYVFGEGMRIENTATSIDVHVDRGGTVNLINSYAVNHSTQTGGIFQTENNGERNYNYTSLNAGWTIGNTGLTIKRVDNVVYFTGNIIPGTITKGTNLGPLPSFATPRFTLRLPVFERSVTNETSTHFVEVRSDGTIRIDSEVDWKSRAYSQYFFNFFYIIED